MNKTLIWVIATALMVTACGGGSSVSEKDKQIAENQKEIELLKQQAEVQRLQNELQQTQVAAASDAQVYQLVASAVAETIPAAAQTAAKAGEIVQGTDGQQDLYDGDTSNWLLYGAVGAAAGYMMANAMNSRNMAKYAPVNQPTAAVTRVYQDYRAKNPAFPHEAGQGVSPRQAIASRSMQQKKATEPAYRPSNQGYSNTRRSFGGRRKR